MKLQTAVRYAHTIAQRVKSVNGLLATPLCEQEAVRISRVWVFGSTVKGSQSPNDLDLLIEMKPVGRWREWYQGKLDKDYKRRYGYWRAIRSDHQALVWLTKGMKNVSRHLAHLECITIDKKVMIYPRNDLLAELPAFAPKVH